MQELLLRSWGPQIIAYSQQHPWRVSAAVLVLLLDMMFRPNRGTGGDADIGGWDFGGGLTVSSGRFPTRRFLRTVVCGVSSSVKSLSFVILWFSFSIPILIS
ncbi:MAG: hypothetical protein QOJ86_4027 [Bradyrhizobium sp.]|jgi:hypothetical protein|nr:hypothetical protein [Bradyrhizobium sp.]